MIQEYILGDKLEENVKLICKIEKLDEEKARVIIENITISILVGLLPISIAKETLIESFRSRNSFRAFFRWNDNEKYRCIYTL